MSWDDHYTSSWGSPPPVGELPQATLVSFIDQQVIPKFEKQREHAQFAVLVLCSRDNCIENLETIKYSPSNWQGDPLLDKRQPGMPGKYRDFNNYIVARPSERIHAEHWLISQLDALCTSFAFKTGEQPSYIILYTWITPCSSCAQLIKDKLSQAPYRDIPRVVAYTTSSHAEGDNVWAARESLKEAGITVLEIPHKQLAVKGSASLQAV